MILLLDVGNTRIRWAVMRGGEVRIEGAEAHRASADLVGFFAEIWRDMPPPREVAVSCVAGDKIREGLSRWCESRWGIRPQFVTATASALGVVNAYLRPGQLGSDRWLAMIAARRLLGPQHACVVDCGTAVTIDWLRADGQHLGGFILPGRDAMIGALRRKTALGSLGELADVPQLGPGLSTQDCVTRGALLAISGAIESSVALLSSQLDARVTCVLTGGGAEAVSRWLSTDYRLQADAVLMGLADWVEGRFQAEGT